MRLLRSVDLMRYVLRVGCDVRIGADFGVSLPTY